VSFLTLPGITKGRLVYNRETERDLLRRPYLVIILVGARESLIGYQEVFPRSTTNTGLPQSPGLFPGPLALLTNPRVTKDWFFPRTDATRADGLGAMRVWGRFKVEIEDA